MQTIVVAVVIGGVLVILLIVVIDTIGRFVASFAATCALHTAILRADTCVGNCPPGSGAACTALTTRPHFGGLLGVQDATCGCVAPPPPPPPGGGGGTAGGGGGTAGGGGSGGGD